MYENPANAPSNKDLRPYKAPFEPGAGPFGTGGFPLYPNLANTLAKAANHPDPDNVIPHVMATCSAYAYAGFGQKGDPETVAMIMARMGLEENRCRVFEQRVGAMYISSGAYLIQSKDHDVVILCYRGTQPEDIISILTDADVAPERITVDLDGQKHYVHAGFYRNMRATRHLVMGALQRAAEGYSINREDPEEKKGDGFEALYITGHSLGGAMAALMGVTLICEPRYQDIAKKLKAIYTFGQPMLGNQQFARACENKKDTQGVRFLRDNLVRYIYNRDVVPRLPPRPVDEYAPFGREFQFDKELDAIGAAFSLAGDVADEVVAVPGDLVEGVGEAFNLTKNPLENLANLAGNIVSLPVNVLGHTLKWANSPLGRMGGWKEQKGKARSEQVQNLSGFAIVAPLASLAGRLDLTRTVPFKYSFKDHSPNHYVSALAPAGVWSEYGGQR
ncbi:lipase family protein [Streptomyces sp. NPDC059862]|uniref:lipase family protein n=1 Tax=Streptomyces sp. NPDC059862 TaxID=3346975 RepID=UPI00364C778E